MIMDLLAFYNTLRAAGYYAVGVLVPLLHVVLALVIWRDARGRPTVLAGRGVWAAAALLGGIPAVALYWAAHHSTLRAGAERS